MQKLFKYSILTFVIGKDYEKVREILYPQSDVKYLLITDDPSLKSDTWKVVYDESLLKCSEGFERCFKVRYNVFDYCSTDVCITIDVSMQIKGSLDNLFYAFELGKYDLCLMPHPCQNSIIDEYYVWIDSRGYSLDQAANALKFIEDDGYDFNYKGLYQIGFTIKRRNQICKDIDRMVWNKLCMLSKQLGYFERLDQTIYSYVVNKYFNQARILPVSEQILHSYAIQFYKYNSDQQYRNDLYNLSKPDMKYVLNQIVECMYLK